VLELRVSGVVLQLERFVLRQVHVGFLMLVECLQVLLSIRWFGVVVSVLPRFQYCLSISSEFSVQFGHMSMFPVTTVVKHPLCLFLSPKLSDTGCVLSGESQV
jgi:hypothetical protein